MKQIALFLICLPLFLWGRITPIKIEEKLVSAKAGDFIVAKQDKVSSLLVIKKISEKKLLLEEISFFQKQKNQSWQKWVENGAPGHTAWIYYEIDFSNSSKITQCYSKSRNCFLNLTEEESFFSTLMQLPLFSPTQRREKENWQAPHSR